MTRAVNQIPTSENAAAKWETYDALVRAQWTNETLLIDIEHQKKIALAWRAWRDAFLGGQ